jgi:uncharacterized membrane protein (DUF2068 family)
LIAAYKFTSGLLLCTAGFGLFRLMNRDLGEVVEPFVTRLHLDPENRYVHEALSFLSGIDRKHLLAIQAGTFASALLRFVEGTGLVLQKRWGEYLVVVMTGSLLPLELYAIARKPGPLRIAVLVVNLAILIYLVARLRQERRERAAGYEELSLEGQTERPSAAPSALVLPTTIDEVVAALDAIVTRSIEEKSRLGCFAALYRTVTVQVRDGIAARRFDDGPRMERLDVTFANRYLAAIEKFRRGDQASRCWIVAFEAAGRWRPLILQHLLAGMNAHINFDLGIAAAETCPSDQLPALKHDFDLINVILASLVNQVIEEISEVSPKIRFLDRIDPSKDDAIINFSLVRARDSAWEFATKLAALSPEEREPVMSLRDAAIADLGRLVVHPIGLFFNFGLLAIRLRESNDVPRVIAVLDRVAKAGD